MQDFFADLLGNISVGGGVVRFDFMRITPAVGDAPAKAEFSHRLAMPIEGFLRALEMQESIKQKMLADGVLVEKNKQSGEFSPS